LPIDLLRLPNKREIMNIRKATESDASAIAEIYNYYVLNTIITFEIDPVSPDDMRKRIEGKIVKYDWIVGEANGKITGYAYYGPYRERAAYDQTVESTVYLAKEERGKGYGRQIYGRLIEMATERGYRQMIGVIALPNPESVKLHSQLGFVEAGILKKVGYKFGRYLDTGMWQKTL
jgi:L-amino acid N-acyltransferase YncA